MHYALLLSALLLASTVAAYRSSTSGYVVPLHSVMRPRDVTAGAAEPHDSTIVNDDTTTTTTTTIDNSSTGSSSAKPTTPAVPLTTLAALKPSSADPPPKDESASAEPLTEQPVSVPTTAPSDNDGDPDPDQSKRRIINYDQRQEGQYNIRADLENFMIVLIPPSPSDGLNLLDLLTKSALRRNSQSSKQRRKQYGALRSAASKYRHPIRSSTHAQSNLQYVSRQPVDAAASRSGYLQASPYASGQVHSTAEGLSAAPTLNRLSDYIEGRTPYHVDISASDDEQARLHPDSPVDVLPPPYPLAYQHLIRPYHLEAEPTVIQALPPSELSAATHASGNFLESYNQLLASGLTGTGDLQAPPITTAATSLSTGDGSGYFRISRAIRGDSDVDSNRITAPKSLSSAPHFVDAQPIYRAEHSSGAAELYPPIDVPHLYLTPQLSARNFELAEEDNREQDLDDVDAHVGEYIVPPADLPAEDDIEWARLLDTFVKDMRTARCAPGHRRDSYGVCREIEGY